MKKNYIIWGIALILVALAVYSANSYTSSYISKNTNSDSPTAAPTAAAAAQPDEPKFNPMQAIPFLLEDLNGNEVSLESLAGKKIFLNFWATWCPACRSEMPDIEKLYQETKDSDLVIVTINAGEKKGTIEKFMKDNDYNFMVLMDSDSSASASYRIRYLPTSFFINTKGEITYKYEISMSYDQMKEHLDTLE